MSFYVHHQIQIERVILAYPFDEFRRINALLGAQKVEFGRRRCELMHRELQLPAVRAGMALPAIQGIFRMRPHMSA